MTTETENLKTFVQWLQDNGATGLSNFDICDMEGTGRGVKSLADIPEGSKTPQVSIPRDLMLTQYDTIQHPVLKDALGNGNIKELLRKYSSATLAIRLLYEKSLPDSKWKPYLDVLPTTYDSTIYWSDSEMAGLAEGNLYYITKQYKNQIAEEYNTLVKAKLLKKYPNIFNKKHFQLANYKWAVATVWSRAIDLTLDGRDERLLVPFVDMFNHSFDAKSKFSFNYSQKAFELTIQSAVASGSQAFINYGPIGNSKLLSLYGFTVHNNPHDYVELVMQLPPNVPLYNLKSQFLQQQGISPTHIFHLKLDELIDEFPVNILGTARVHRIDEEDLPRIKYAFHREEIVSEVNEVQVLKALEEALRGMYSAYQQDTAKDLEVYNTINESTPNTKSTHALRIRMSDKNIIANAGNHIGERIRQIQEYLMGKINTGTAQPL